MNITATYAANLNCTDLATMATCLRGKSARDLILQAGEDKNPFTSVVSWNPVVDGVELSNYPSYLFKTGQVNDVAFLGGTNTNEGNLFVWPFHETDMSVSEYKDFVSDLVSSYDPVSRLNATEFEEVFAIYPPIQGGDNRPMASAVLTDSAFRCPTQLTSQYYAKTHKRVFLYRFNHRSGSCTDVWSTLVPGVFHTEEIIYVFGTPGAELCLFSSDENALATRVQTLWTNLAKSLDPGTAPPDTAFPAYENATRKSLVLQTPKDVIEQNYFPTECAFWDRVHYRKFDPKPNVLEEPLLVI